MPAVAPQLISAAARLVSDVLGGERGSVALSRAIGEARLTAGGAEQLSALVYGALRRRKRALAALGALGVTEPPSRATVIAAALFEGRLEVREAVELDPTVTWGQLAEVEQRVLADASAVRRIELLGSLPDWLAERLLSEYGDEAEPLAASLSEPAPRSLRVNGLAADVAEAHERLEQEGARIEPGRYGRCALVIEGAFNPFTTRAFHDGVFAALSG